MLVDDDGYLLDADLITRRPSGHRRRAAGDGATVDIVIPFPLLHEPGAASLDPRLLHGWRGVLAEVRRKIADAAYRPAADPTRRFADARMRRYLIARTPVCVWPYCRNPACRAEIDHALDHALGGPTDETNQSPRCRQHHALKSRHGWKIAVTGPSTYDVTSHLGTVHPATLPPAHRPLPDLCRTWRQVLCAFRVA